MSAAGGDMDDEETLSLLLSTPDKVSASRLQELSERFLRDARPSPAFKGIVQAAQAFGFALDGLANDIPTPPPVRHDATGPLPTVFETPKGKLHVDATTALLQCSKQQAVKWTHGALSKTTLVKDISPFLGTSALLEKVLHYSCSQKLARLNAVGELLRLELLADDDASMANHDAIDKTLGALDNTVRIRGGSQSRGLFRMLLEKTMIQQDTFHIEQLLPAKPLCKPKATTINGEDAQQQQHKAWQHLNAVLLQIQRAFHDRERLAAMQVLSTLLYSRMDVFRQDLVVLLLAFQTNDTWFTSTTERMELPRLAGLIGVESMGLWRVTADEEWVADHPLMEGLFDQENIVMREMEVIKALLDKYLQQIPNRGPVQSRLETPEALVALAYGLLLKVAHAAILPTPEGANSGAYWQNFNDDGMQICQKSNNCSSFDYFYTVMVSLVPPLLSRQVISPPTTDAVTMALTNGQQSDPLNDLSPACVTFASVGRELLSSAVIAFEDTLLSLGHDGACDNIGMLCNLVAVVHQNSPVLCRRFWTIWENMKLAQADDQFSPIHRLLEKAYELATKSTYKGTLPGVSPLLRMVSAVAYDSETTKLVLTEILPPSLVRQAVASCVFADALSEQCRIVLDSLRVLTQTGNSTSCRVLLRDILEENSRDSHTDGPRMLVSAAVDRTSAESVLLILGTLVHDAPEPWLLKSSQLVLNSNWLAPDIINNESTTARVAFVSFLGTVIERLNFVLFSPSIRLEEKASFLSVVDRATRACASLLSASHSPTGREPVCGDLVYHILKCLANILVCIRPAMANESCEIQEQIFTIRFALISLFAEDMEIGGTVLYFATLPVTMCLANKLLDYLHETAILDAPPTDMRGLACGPGRSGMILSPTQFLSKAMDSIHLNLEDVCAKGWLDNDTRRIWQTAEHGLKLLIWWALTVEDMVMSENDMEILSLSPFKLLSKPSFLPVICRSERAMLTTWSTVAPSYFALLIRYICQGEPADVAASTAGFLGLCVVHSKRQLDCGNRDDSLFRMLSKSASFRALAKKLITESLPGSLARMGHKDAVLFGILRILAICSDISAPMALGVLGEHSGDAISIACAVVCDVMKDIEKLDIASVLSASLLHKIDVARRCLELIVSFWKQARGSGWDMRNDAAGKSMISIVEEAQVPLMRFVGFLFMTAESQLSVEPAFDCFLALIHEVLSTEIAWAMEKAGATEKTRLFRSLESVIAKGFVSTFQYQAKMNGFSGYHAAYSKLSVPLSGSMRDGVARILPFLSLTSRLDDYESLELCGINAYLISSYLPLLTCDPARHPDLLRDLDSLRLTRHAFILESRRLVSWEMLCHQLLVFFRMMRSTDKDVAPTFLTDNEVRECAQASANALYELLDAVEHAERELPVPIVIAEGLSMTKPLAACCLDFLELDSNNNQDWNDVLERVIACMGVSLAVRATSLAVSTKLSALALSLFQKHIDLHAEATSDLRGRSMKIKLELFESCCNMIRKMEPVAASVNVRQYSQCLHCVVSLLSAVVASSLDAKEDREKELLFLASMLNILVDCDTMRAVFQQTSFLMSSGHESGYDVDVLLPCLELLTALASQGYSPLLLLLIDSQVAWVIGQMSFMMQHGDVNSGACHLQRTPGASDRLHDLHRACLRFLSAALNSLSVSLKADKTCRMQFVKLAVDYLVANKVRLDRCLEQCCSLPTFRLTMCSLTEAGLILSIGAELCRPESLASFTTCQDLFEGIESQSKSILITLGSFLGASSAARERFAAIDVATGDFYGDKPVTLAHKLLKSGAPNTRHEGIRFSHFRYGHFEAVTDDEKSRSEQFSGDLRRQEEDASPQSLSSLEDKCRSSVSSKFAFELEYEAAQTLFAAILILWRTHPSSPFVYFSPDEVSQLDAFSLVKRGSTIAFRSKRVVANPSATSLTDQSYIPSTDVKYGEVVRANTSQRTWNVRLLGCKGDTVIVIVSDLAGIEDHVKLHHVLAFCRAPETSSELEESRLTPSVGDLVLALRWCHNMYGIHQSDARYRSLICRCSELLAAFIAKEVSIHRKTGSRSDSLVAIKNQLFDLFGVKCTCDSFIPGRSVQDMLSSDLWFVVREQLSSELVGAAEAEPT